MCVRIVGKVIMATTAQQVPTEAQLVALAPGASVMPFAESGLSAAAADSGSIWSFGAAHVRSG